MDETDFRFRIASPSSKLTDEVADRMVQLVQGGNYASTACAACGITPWTLRAWKETGKRIFRQLEEEHLELDPTGYPEEVIPVPCTAHEWACYRLLYRLEVAEAEAEAFAVMSVRKHFPDQWTAAMTFLERRHPDRWRKRQTLDVGEDKRQDGLDERALIEDPEATRLVHEALEQLAQGRSVPIRPALESENAPAEKRERSDAS